MKQFYCQCGQRAFFDNTVCEGCGGMLGFDPRRLDLRRLEPAANGSYAARDGTQYRLCRNRIEYDACNWLIDADSDTRYCIGCQHTEIIPALDSPGNLLLWSRTEAAKRRLLYTLFRLGLPIDATDGANRLRFRILEDQQRNPNVAEQTIQTGHREGIITINLAEADDVARNALREQMQERYRTLLGHFRHECGHYFFDRLAGAVEIRQAFRQLFGDERRDYAETLAQYYRHGPPTDWPTRFVSAYASAHPLEDWAETFAHYLHIVDSLETAAAAGIVAADRAAGTKWIREWMELSVTLNELSRSLGVDDPYPFVLSQPAIKKLEFINRLARPQPVSATAGLA